METVVRASRIAVPAPRGGTALRAAGATALVVGCTVWAAVLVPSSAPPPSTPEGPPSLVTPPDLQILDRLREAINSHDPVRVAACFTSDFRAELPHHPERSFTGAQRVVANWTSIFASAPHLTATVLRSASSGAEIWSEWEMTEPTADGPTVRFVGPVVLTARDGRIATARFYLDQVDTVPG